MPMKCLTICQPWASAIMEGIKDVENRSWSTKHRGPLAIHAGLSTKWIRSLEVEHGAGVCDEEAMGALRRMGEFELLPRGVLLGWVEMLNCVEYRLSGAALRDDPFACGPWCWLFGRRVRWSRPAAYQGQQGLYSIPFRAGRLGQ